MKKTFVVCLTILAVSTSAALAAKKKPAAPAAPNGSNMGVLKGSDADMALYAKSQRESGMKKK